MDDCGCSPKTKKENFETMSDCSLNSNYTQSSKLDESSCDIKPNMNQIKKTPKKKSKSYRNPYINFYVSLFQDGKTKGMAVPAVAKYAGCKWSKMSNEDKKQYYKMSQNAKKSRKNLFGKKTKRKSSMITSTPKRKLSSAKKIKRKLSFENYSGSELTSGTTPVKRKKTKKSKSSMSVTSLKTKSKSKSKKLSKKMKRKKSRDC